MLVSMSTWRENGPRPADSSAEQLQMGLQGITMASLTRTGWSVAEVEVFLAGLRKEMKEPRWQIQDQA